MVLKPDMVQDLRSMVREVLRDVMVNRAPGSGASVESVRIANDQDLAAFVARIIEAQTLERIRTGQLRFTLGIAASPPQTQPPGEMLTGVITEQKIDRLAGTGVLVLGPSAVLTPLARDKARKLGLKLERRR